MSTPTPFQLSETFFHPWARLEPYRNRESNHVYLISS